MSSPPGLSPSSGTTSNFENPTSLEKWNTVCVAVCLSITSTLFLLRTYVRIFIKREWALEDYMCCFSWAFLVAFCALNTVVMHKHGGIHMWDLTLPQKHQATYWFNIASIVYAPAILSTKLAIILLYRHVFSPHRKGTFDLSIRLLILVLCLFYLATTIVKIWECTPRERIWNKSVPGTCIDVPVLLDASGICNTLTDLIILLMPIHVVWNLKTTNLRKIGVILVFTVGFIAPAFSLVGVIVRFKTSDSQDTTWNQPTILLWGAAEVSTGLICFCIPALAILAHRRASEKPTHSVLKGGDSVSRYTISGRKRATSTDEVNLFDKGDLFERDLELQQHNAAEATGVRIPAPTTVVTGISGGADSSEKSYDDLKLSDGGLEAGEGQAQTHDPAAGIIRTVRMEQTYL